MLLDGLKKQLIFFIACLTICVWVYYNLSGGDNLSRVFGFRLPEHLRNYLQSRAKESETSVGHYIVKLIDADRTKNECVSKKGEKEEKAE